MKYAKLQGCTVSAVFWWTHKHEEE